MKTAFVTGIGRGIGKALAQEFLARGFAVIGTTTMGAADWTEKNLTLLKLDLQSSTSISECKKALESLGFTLDIVVNNAGVLLDEEETVLVPELLRKTLEVNLIGTADLTEQIAPLVAPGGHIMFISSTAGSLELVGKASHYEGHYPAYKISKAALNMYMRTLALRLSGKATVSSVHPGWVRTAMGGEDADISPEEAAKGIADLALSTPETGQFWFKGEKLPW